MTDDTGAIDLTPPENTEKPVELDTNNTPAQKENPVEIKIVLSIKGQKTVIGFQRTGTDPVYFVRENLSLRDTVNQIPVLMVDASKRWSTSARYPKTERAIPNPPTPPPVNIPTSNRPAQRKSNPEQPSLLDL